MDYVSRLTLALVTAVTILLPLLETVDLYQFYNCAGIENFNPSACSCYCSKQNCNDPSKISCKNAGFSNSSLKTALSNLPTSVEEVIINGDHLEELPVNLLGEKDVGKLESLDLSDNKIRAIHGKTFHHVRNVKTLKLDNNDLYFHNRVNLFSNFYNLTSLFLNNAFNNSIPGGKHVVQLYEVIYAVEMKNLQYLYLNDNNLWNGTLLILHYLPALKHLHLSRNRVEFVHLETSWLNSIELLNMTNNSISGFSKDAIKALDSSHSARKSGQTPLIVDVTENPFVCDCKAQHFVQWLNSTDVDIYRKDSLKCARPAHLAGRTLLSLSLADMVCTNPTEEPVRRKGRGSIIAVGVVIGLVGILFIIVVYMNRKGVIKRTREIVHSSRMALGIYNHRGYSNVEVPIIISKV